MILKRSIINQNTYSTWLLNAVRVLYNIHVQVTIQSNFKNEFFKI